MAIDPVVLLVEDIHSTEAALSKATRLYASDHRQEHGDLVNLLLARMKRLYHDISETAPTSASGAAELVRMAARRLPFSQSRYTAHLHAIADRLFQGRRDHADLVWLRAFQAALDDGVCGRDGSAVAPWLGLAVIGASRPVVVFRTVPTERKTAPWKFVLTQHDAAPGL